MVEHNFKNETYIVIAAYNEETTIGMVLSGLKKEGYKHLVVVDDGSDDNTFKKSRFCGAVALRHIMNRGQGASLQTGISYALNNGAKYIVTFDADGQHQPEEIEKMVLPLTVGDSDVCLGSRFRVMGSNVPFIRRCLLKAGVLLMFFMYGIRLTDSHNGFRAMTRDAAEKINITADRMEHASQILEEIMLNKLKYLEIPVTIKYTEYSQKHGQSSWNAVNIAYQTIKGKFLK